MGTSSRAAFGFTWSRQSLSKQSLTPEHWQDHPIHEDQMCYCVHIRATLREGECDQPPPSHAWSGSLIADMFQEGLEEQVTKAGEAILFFGWQSCKEGLPLGYARDVGFSLMGLISWAGRTAEVVATVNTVQEGHQAISEAVVEKRTKARGPGHPHRTMKVMRAPTTAYDIEDRMQGMEEDAPEGEVRSGNVVNCSPEQKKCSFSAYWSR